MTDIAISPAPLSPVAPAVLRRLRGFDLVVIAATVIADIQAGEEYEVCETSKDHHRDKSFHSARSCVSHQFSTRCH